LHRIVLALLEAQTRQLRHLVLRPENTLQIESQDAAKSEEDEEHSRKDKSKWTPIREG
jgi:hypothetical protein